MRAAGESVYWVKFHGNAFSKSGTPDLHITYRGQSHWLEFKAGNNKPTKLQEAEMTKWREAGAVSTVVRSLEDMLEALRPN